MPMDKPWRHVLWTAPLTLVIAMPLPVAAQERESTAIDEIVVTARKREETLQDVPLAVTAITAAQIETGGIKDVEDAIQLDSSLNFDQGIAPYDTRIVIRGLSPTRGRPNVASLVDGVDVSSESIGVAGGSLLINPRLLDVARIEVVKGPQSALYGRSAFAGAIQYVTKDPSKELEGSVNVTGGNYDFREYKAELSGPIIGEKLGFRITALKYEEEGYYRNSLTGNKLGGSEGEGIAATLKFQATEDLDFKLRYEYSHDAFEMQPQAFTGFNTVNQVPAGASVCNGGIIRDQSCEFLPSGARNVSNLLSRILPGGGLAPQGTLGPLGTAGGPLGTLGGGVFDDMTVPAYVGSLGTAGDRTVALTPDYGVDQSGRTDFPGADRNVNRVSLVANWAVGFGTFSSLSGYTDANVFSAVDLDKYAERDPITGRDISSTQQAINTDGDTHQFSQELRFTSDFDGPFQAIAGLQYWHETVSQLEKNGTIIGHGTRCAVNFNPITNTFTASQGPGSCGGAGIFPQPQLAFTTTRSIGGVGQFADEFNAAKDIVEVRRETDHKSFYAQFTWDITEKLTASIEGRYVDEDNEVLGPDPIERLAPPAGTTPAAQADSANSGPGTQTICGTNGTCVLPGIPRGPRGFGPVRPVVYNTFERNDSYITPRAQVDYRITDDALVYGSYSQARKPGGFSTVTIGAFGLNNREDVEFDPEKLKQYEIGWKSAWLDRSLLVNGSLFYIDFTDKQVSTQEIRGSTLGNVIKNAGGAEISGLELSTQWRPIRQLTFSGSYTYLDSEYTDYTVTGGGAPEVARTGSCNIVTAAGALTCEISRNGNQLEDTPEHSFAAQLGWRDKLGESDWEYFTDLVGRYQSKRFLEDDNTVWVDNYWLADLRFGLQSDHWTVIAFVDNLFDDDKIKSGGTGPGNALADFRFGQVGNAIAGQPSFGLVPSPLIPTNVYANMPDPRTYRLQLGYKF